MRWIALALLTSCSLGYHVPDTLPPNTPPPHCQIDAPAADTLVALGMFGLSGYLVYEARNDEEGDIARLALVSGAIGLVFGVFATYGYVKHSRCLRLTAGTR